MPEQTSRNLSTDERTKIASRGELLIYAERIILQHERILSTHRNFNKLSATSGRAVSREVILSLAEEALQLGNRSLSSQLLSWCEPPRKDARQNLDIRFAALSVCLASGPARETALETLSKILKKTSNDDDWSDYDDDDDPDAPPKESPNRNDFEGRNAALVLALASGNVDVCQELFANLPRGYSRYSPEDLPIGALRELESRAMVLPRPSMIWLAKQLPATCYLDHLPESVILFLERQSSAIPASEQGEISKFISSLRTQNDEYDYYEKPYRLAREGHLRDGLDLVNSPEEKTYLICEAACAGHLSEAEAVAREINTKQALRGLQIGTCQYQAKQGDFAPGLALARELKPSLLSVMLKRVDPEIAYDLGNLLNSLANSAFYRGEFEHFREIDRLDTSVSLKQIISWINSGDKPAFSSQLQDFINGRLPSWRSEMANPIGAARELIAGSEIFEELGDQIRATELQLKAASLLVEAEANPDAEQPDHYSGMVMCCELLMKRADINAIRPLLERIPEINPFKNNADMVSSESRLITSALKLGRLDVWNELYANFPLNDRGQELRNAALLLTQPEHLVQIIPLIDKHRADIELSPPVKVSHFKLPDSVADILGPKLAPSHAKEALELTAQIGQKDHREKTFSEVADQIISSGRSTELREFVDRPTTDRDLKTIAVSHMARHEMRRELADGIEFKSDDQQIKLLLSQFQHLPDETQEKLFGAIGARLQEDECRTVLSYCERSGKFEQALALIQGIISMPSSAAESLRDSLASEVGRILAQAIKSEAMTSPHKIEPLVTFLTKGGKIARDELLRVARESLSNLVPESNSARGVMRVLDGIARTANQRGNELIADALCLPGLDPRRGKFFVNYLIKNGYFDASTRQWLDAREQARRELPGPTRRKESVNDNAGVSAALGLGLTPSREIMDFLAGPKAALIAPLDIGSFSSRKSELARFEVEFKGATSALELVKILNESAEKRLAFYILNSGRDRFDLVNNYSLEKFTSMLATIASISPHPEPLDRLRAALLKQGASSDAVNNIIKNLVAGAHPLSPDGRTVPARPFRLDVSNADVIAQANREVGAVLGRRQLGACLKAALYRSFLKSEEGEIAQKLISDFDQASSLQARVQQIDVIESSFPNYVVRAEQQLAPEWKKLGAKLPFTVTAQDVLANDSCTVSCEILIAAIEDQRLSLQRAGQQALAALRGENPELRRISADITKKERSMAGLGRGLAHNPQLQVQIDSIEKDLVTLKARREELSRQTVASRFDNLPEAERKAALENEQKHLAALGEKDTSAIFACMVLETLGDTPVTERDSDFIKEVASHLQHPFETVHRIADLDPMGRPRREVNRALLRYIDKAEDLMTMVRCADSKICCFTSSNYEMQVAHNTPNRYWVASLLADPLSFCFSIELPNDLEAVNDQRSRRQNIGFVFGTFGLIDGEPVLCLNGVYISTGGDARAVESVLNEIEYGFARPLGIKANMLGSQHGGAIGGNLPGYALEDNSVLRLRALAHPSGKVETRIYDDFSQVINTVSNSSKLVKWFS